MRLCAFVLALTVSGCTLIGAVHMRERAQDHNEQREEALAKGRPAPPADNVGAHTVVGGVIGLAIDVAVVFVGLLLFVPRQD
ncbi:MAG: hypothetical protein WKG01_35850 [Kofleriaceae bacterium]